MYLNPQHIGAWDPFGYYRSNMKSRVPLGVFVGAFESSRCSKTH